MRADEEGTMNTWWSYRREIVDPVIEEYSGRIVKLTGDGFLAEYRLTHYVQLDESTKAA